MENVALQRIRDVLSTALRESFQQAGIDWEASLRHDLGDGIRVTVPAGTPKSSLIHPLIYEFGARLRAHNRLAGPATQIRVRIAVHAGDVCLDQAGEVTGAPLEVLARLLDAAPVRNALAQAPESVAAAVLISQHFYDDTIQHGYPGIDSDSFREVTVAVKKYTGKAWLYVSGYPTTPPESVHALAPGDQSPDRSEMNRSKMITKASGHGMVFATQNGSQHIRIRRKS